MCLKIAKKSQLHIGCWNINGHKNKGFDKYSDPRFVNEICHKDIICLIETHCSLEESLSLDGFTPVHLTRPKSKGTYKRSGGISIFVKSELRPGVKFLEHVNNDYIWLQLCSNFFGLKDDIFICYIYNPPENSSYTKSLREDIFDLIEKDISKYSDTGKILLAGDLNARTGTQVLDFINNDESLDNIPVFDKISPDLNLPVRYSMDEVLSTRGKSLNEICIQSGLRILNGRTPGDFTGQLTCYTPNDLNSIITEAADISLKLKRPKKKNPKHLKNIRQPKWFDISLTGLRRQLDSKEKLLKKFSKDPIVRTSYFSLLKLYRKTRKQKLKEFRRSVVDELDNLHENNPNKYWNLLKDLSKDTNKSTSPDIPCNTWFDYFKELNKSKINTTDNNFINRFKQLEKEKIFSELDFQINDKELILFSDKPLLASPESAVLMLWLLATGM
ncbi:unnamed protein product [Mytilus edulis]|uniref:Endonuclease/exonuclease/phosphatase domain-containing protein n=1 Tax=Mytilus edulis TaxID=6550 RepID=A0A8S3UQ83_MYTED|nr:unnamed protein product [Mytilus edulis]